MPGVRAPVLPRARQGSARGQQRRHGPRVPGPRRPRVRELAVLSHDRRLELQGARQALVPAGLLQHPRQARRPPRSRRHPRVDPGAEVLPRGAAGGRTRPHHRAGPGGLPPPRAARGDPLPGARRGDARRACALAGPRLAPRLARGGEPGAAPLRLRVPPGGRRLRLARRAGRTGPLPALRAVADLPDDAQLRARPSAGPPRFRPFRRPRPGLPARGVPRRGARRLVLLCRRRPRGRRLQAGLRPRLRGARRRIRPRRRASRREGAAGRGARGAR